jgi:uncharacterized RDD family membrane protein YckC
MKIKCPACSQNLAIPESAAGKVVKCPCGKQLRAPSPTTSAAPAAKPVAAPKPIAKPAAARPAANQPVAKKPAQPAGGGMGGFDLGIFDELTDDDLKPIPGAGASPLAAPAPSGNAAKLLREHAAMAGGASKSVRVGKLASPWSRLAAAIIDGFMAGPVFAILMAVFGSQLDVEAIRNAPSEYEAQVATQKFIEELMKIYFIVLPIAYAPPIALYAWMVSTSGQTPGKKLCKIRIVTEDTNQIPGFVKGVLLRSWVIFILYAIPFVGLVGVVMIFSKTRQCLHDRLAGTIVVET